MLSLFSENCIIFFSSIFLCFLIYLACNEYTLSVYSSNKRYVSCAFFTVLHITSTFFVFDSSAISSRLNSCSYNFIICLCITFSAEKSSKQYVSFFINPYLFIKSSNTGGSVAVIIANFPPICEIVFKPYISAATILGSYDCISSIITFEYFNVAAIISVPNALYTNKNNWSTVDIVNGALNIFVFSNFSFADFSSSSFLCSSTDSSIYFCKLSE